MGRTLKPAAVRVGLGEWVDVIDSRGRRVVDRRGNVRKRALTWVGLHTFRHTCATLLFNQGCNATQVSLFLGHTVAGFTHRTYVHLRPEDLPTPAFGSWDTPPDAPLPEEKGH